MQKFLKAVALFLIPIGLYFSAELLFPINAFTYRPWEALLFKTSGLNPPFYPNQKLDMISYGDLCFHTNFAVAKKENWMTDKLGYRNNKFIEDPDVILIGDSFITGSALTQDSTLTNILNNKSGGELKYYNIAPANFSNFISLLEKKIIKKPRVIIYGILERENPLPINKINYHYKNSLDICIDRISRMYIFEWAYARINRKTEKGTRANDSSAMFFFGSDQKYTEDRLIANTEIITSYKNYCDSIGVNFLFLPLPNKETIYYDKVPLLNQSDYIVRWIESLKKNNVYSINTVQLFNAQRNKDTATLLYHLDDTHWNKNGVMLVANEIDGYLSSYKANR